MTWLKSIIATALIFAGASQTLLAAPAKDRSVVIISLDGFPAYALEDPRLPVPTLRKLAKSGAWSRCMQPVNPTVTWPNHTTMVTGLYPRDHGLLFNGKVVHEAGSLSMHVDPNAPKDQMVHVPTLYDIAHDSGLTTAQVDWVAINNAKTIDWAFPEKAVPSDPLIQEMVSKGVIQAEDIADKPQRSILWIDQIWTEAAAYIIREHKPNLLLFHLLTLDSTSHRYGPSTLATTDAMAFLDSCVAKLLDAIQAAGMADRTTVLVVSDHGFTAVHKHIQVDSILQKAGVTGQATAVPEGGSAMLYVAKENHDETIAKLRAAFAGVEGVVKIADVKDYPALGLPDPYKDSQMADLVIYSQPGYDFGRDRNANGQIITEAKETTGAHGYLNTQPDMNAIFIASGKGIRSGVILDQITNRAVAPTVAQLLGIKLPRTLEGPLSAVLQ